MLAGEPPKAGHVPPSLALSLFLLTFLSFYLSLPLNRSFRFGHGVDGAPRHGNSPQLCRIRCPGRDADAPSSRGSNKNQAPCLLKLPALLCIFPPASLFPAGTQRFGIKGKLASRFVGPFKIVGKRGDLAYQLELPLNFANVHDVFHVSQLRKCFKTPERTVDLQEDLSYHEHPIAILEETERKTRKKSIKFLKVKWSHHSEKEATWEREDYLCSEFPKFFRS